jgi:hypothetical protein
MDGDIDDFIMAYLKSQITNENPTAGANPS